MFLGKSAGGSTSHVSGSTQASIDEEVRSIVDQCYSTAQRVLEENRSKLDAMADALMKYETIDTPQIDDIMNDKTPRPPKGWGDNGSNDAGGSAASEAEDVTQERDAPSDSVGGPAEGH
ncbi:hypothetical protein A3738_28415 [Oleiphilus sp. HI0066]|nr:hypothetical protein A3738_28415 [Oleiphilus sp. HI0066]